MHNKCRQDDALSIRYIYACTGVSLGMFNTLIDAGDKKEDFEHLFLNDLTPAQPRARYEYIQSLERSGLPFPVMLLTYSSGNNTGNIHFVWKVPVENAAEECFQSSLAAIEQVKLLLPQFYTRAMRQAMFEKFGRVSPGVKPAVLRLFYKDLTGDCSASHDLPESVVDKRVCEILGNQKIQTPW